MTHPTSDEKPIREAVAVWLCREREDDLLLARDAGGWALPAGRVVEGEALADAVMRVSRERAGLSVTNAGNLIGSVEHELADEIVLTFLFEVGRWEGEPDPARAHLLPRAEAIARLLEQPARVAREPAIMLARGQAPTGTTWRYRRELDGSDRLVVCEADGIRLLQDPGISRRAGLIGVGFVGLGIGASLWCILGLLGG